MASLDNLEQISIVGDYCGGTTHIEILSVNFIVLGQVEVLLCDENALYRTLSVKAEATDVQRRDAYRGRGTREFSFGRLWG